MNWIILTLIFILLVFLYIKFQEIKLLRQVTDINRGTRSERKLVLKLLKHGIPSETIFHDLYVKIGNSNYCQIDLAVATRSGIIVFEVKDYSGWIFGRTYQKEWTQVLAYGNVKHRFYNPILQNEKHIHHLKKQLTQFEKIPFFSIIVFYGDCELKNSCNLPEDTFLVHAENVLNVIEIIRQNDPAPYVNKREVIDLLKDGAFNEQSNEIQIQHIKNVRTLLNRVYRK